MHQTRYSEAARSQLTEILSDFVLKYNSYYCVNRTLTQVLHMCVYVY